MQSPADYLHLARRDPDLPGLQRLLDVDAFAEIIQAQLSDADLRQVRRTYIRYKPATSCLVSYELDIAGTKTLAYAKAVTARAMDKLEKYRHRPGVPGFFGLQRTVLLPEKIIISGFPNDNRLKQLPKLTDPSAWQKRLQKMLPDAPDLWTAELHTLRYKPERRYVGQLNIKGQPKAVVKAYTNDGFRQAKVNAKTFQSIASVQVIPRLGHSNQDCLLVFPWVTGQPLNDLTFISSNWDLFAQTGATLAHLHQQNPKHLLCLSRTDEVTNLLSVAADLSWLCPQWKRRIQTIAVTVSANLLDSPSPSTAIHGDFNAEQVLCSTDRNLTKDAITFIDFDRAIRSDPSADLGSFIAKLHWDELRQALSAEQREQLASALISGYRTVAPNLVSSEQIQQYITIGLLRLAAEPFRYCDPDWLNKIDAILQRIEKILSHLPPSSFRPRIA